MTAASVQKRSNVQIIAAWLAWPTLVMTLGGAASWAFGLGYNNDLVFLAVAVLNLSVLVLAEFLLPLRPEWNVLRDKQVPNDIGHMIAAGIFGANIGHFLRTLIFGSLAVILTDFAGGSLWPVSLPLWAQMILAVFLVDFVFYWQHRMFHSVPFLWRFHTLHHNPETMHVLKSARLHAGEIALRFILMYAPLALLGAPKEVLLWYALLDNLIGSLAHANILVRLPSAVHRLVVTPGVHHLHHAKNMQLGNGNFGGLLSIWDGLFGTFFHPDDHPNYQPGIERNPIPRKFASELAAPFLWERWTAEKSGARG